MRTVLSELDRAIINTYQGGVPICEHPYADMAQRLGIDESQLLARLRHLLASGVLSRFGPLYNIETLGGAFCLAAMQVPGHAFDRVAEQVNRFPEVAHNYERDHELNMWFVIATQHPEGVKDVAAGIESLSGYKVYLFPKLNEYFVELTLQA